MCHSADDNLRAVQDVEVHGTRLAEETEENVRSLVNELEAQSRIHMPGPVGRVGSNSVPPNSSFLLARAISKPSYRLLRQADALLQSDRPIESCLFSQRRQRWKISM